MKAWILSDLHCDHGTIPPPVPPEADIAIIAGDRNALIAAYKKLRDAT